MVISQLVGDLTVTWKTNVWQSNAAEKFFIAVAVFAIY